jgi:hypothetical protein
MIRTASTPVQALAIPVGVAALLLVIAGFTGGAGAPPAEHLQISDASSTQQP